MQDKETYFYKRTLLHLSRVYQNVVNFLNNNPDIVKEYNLDELTILKNTAKHDQNKFREPEYQAYVEITWHYYAKRIKGLENYPVDKVLSSSATIHHIISESHHPEYWDKSFIPEGKFMDIKDDRDKTVFKNPVDASNMPYECILEMICDWKAVSDELGNSVKEWADKTVNKRWKFTDDQVKFIYKVIERFEPEE